MHYFPFKKKKKKKKKKTYIFLSLYYHLLKIQFIFLSKTT